MKKLLPVLLLLLSTISFSQTFPIPQNIGGITTNVSTKGTLGSLTGFTFMTDYTDTTAANLVNYVKFTPGIMIRVNSSEVWVRNSAATAWIRTGTPAKATNGTSLSGDSVILGSLSALNRYTPITLNGFPLTIVHNGVNSAAQSDSNSLRLVNRTAASTSTDSLVTPSLTFSVNGRTVFPSAAVNVKFRIDEIGNGILRIGSSFNNAAYSTLFSMNRLGVIINNLNIQNQPIGIPGGTGGSNLSWGASAAISNTTGSQNLAIGVNSMLLNTKGSENTAVGYNTLAANDTAVYNTAIGSWALNSNTSGFANTAVGKNALLFSRTGIKNTAIGAGAMEQTTTGGFNSVYGEDGFLNNTTGINNTGGGWLVYGLNATGSDNTVFGFDAFVTIANGSQNVGLGSRITSSEDTVNNVIAIGYNAIVSQSNQIIIGNLSHTQIKMFGLTSGTASKAVLFDPVTHILYYTDTTGGSVTTPTWQSTLISSSLLTQNNAVNVAGFKLAFDSAKVVINAKAITPSDSAFMVKVGNATVLRVDATSNITYLASLDVGGSTFISDGVATRIRNSSFLQFSTNSYTEAFQIPAKIVRSYPTVGSIFTGLIVTNDTLGTYSNAMDSVDYDIVNFKWRGKNDNVERSKFRVRGDGHVYAKFLASAVGIKQVRYNTTTGEFTYADTTTGGGGGSGVTSVAAGYGMAFATITTTGSVILDSATVFPQIRATIPPGGFPPWNSITNPTGTQTLAWDDAEINVWTNGSNTETFTAITSNSLTTGTVISSASSSITTGNHISLTTTSFNLAAGNESLDIVVNGANGTSGITATGIRSTVTNTNATSGTNVAANFNASGANTDNWALQTGSVTGGDGKISVNRASSIANQVMVIKSLTNTSGDGIAIRSNDETSTMQLGHQTIATTASMIISTSAAGLQLTTGGLYVGAATTPTARIQTLAQTTSASTGQLKFSSSASVMTSPEAGAFEFTTDNLFFTITTGAARKRILMADPVGGLTSGRVPFITTNGRLTDDASFTYAVATGLAVSTSSTGNILSIGGAITPSAGSSGFVSSLGGSITEAGSGTHSILAGTAILAPIITGGAASVTSAATLYVSGNINASGANNSAIWAVGTLRLGLAGTTAGIINIEGLTSGVVSLVVPSVAGTPTLTFPTITGTLVQYAESSTASTAAPAPTGNARENFYDLTALATNATFAAPSGTSVNHNSLTIRITSSGGPWTLTWNAIYRGGVDIALPPNTTSGLTMYITFLKNDLSSTWDLVGLTSGL